MHAGSGAARRKTEISSHAPRKQSICWIMFACSMSIKQYAIDPFYTLIRRPCNDRRNEDSHCTVIFLQLLYQWTLYGGWNRTW